MRIWIAGLAVAAALMATQHGEAAPWDLRPSLQGESQRPQDANPKQGGRNVRDARRGVPPPPERSSGRLTEEERRELRRDVDRANREIYRRSK